MKKFTITVSPQAGTFGSPAALSATYTPGLTLAQIAPPAGYYWSAPATTVNAGESQAFAAYSAAGSYYASASGSITVNVAKAAPTITTAPAASSVNSRSALSASTLTGGAASVPGTFAWTNGADTVNATGEFGVTFTPEDTANYETVALTASVTAILNENANLSALAVSAGTLAPTFNPATTAYTVTVPNATSSITLTAIKADTNATVSGDGAKSLSVGANRFSITVVAENGTASKTYAVTVTRAAASNNSSSIGGNSNTTTGTTPGNTTTTGNTGATGTTGGGTTTVYLQSPPTTTYVPTATTVETPEATDGTEIADVESPLANAGNTNDADSSLNDGTELPTSSGMGTIGEGETPLGSGADAENSNTPQIVLSIIAIIIALAAIATAIALYIRNRRRKSADY
jgi:hypothetical protein